MNNYASVGVLGATGYVGTELVGILARHARVRLELVTSRSRAGERLRAAGLGRPLILEALEDVDFSRCDVVLSCLPHGESAGRVQEALDAGARVIDLSSDLRVSGDGAPALADEAVYGLVELSRALIPRARLIANPGCYPTAALLALAPLLRRGLVAGPIVVNAASGVTGAGRSPKPELLFGEVAEDYRAYGLGNTHRHLSEMRAYAARVAGSAVDVVFTPHLLPVRRGILETIHVPLSAALSSADARALWQADYAGEPFVEVLPCGAPSLRSVVNTNRLAIGVAEVVMSAPALQVVVAIDNLLKGAAGQAVQNMNLMMGWPETEGLPC